jgi:hypothetical protein
MLEEPHSAGSCKPGDGDAAVATGAEDVIVRFEGDEDLGADRDGCCICLDGYDFSNPCAAVQCGHHFHVPCLLDWRQRSARCPMCQAPLVSAADEQGDATEAGEVGTAAGALIPACSSRADRECDAVEDVISRLRASTLSGANCSPSALGRVRLHLSIEAEMRRQRRERRRRSRERRERLQFAGAQGTAREGVLPCSPAGDSGPIEMVEVISEAPAANLELSGTPWPMNSGGEPRTGRRRRPPPAPSLSTELQSVDRQLSAATSAHSEDKTPKGVFSRFFSCCASSAD